MNFFKKNKSSRAVHPRSEADEVLAARTRALMFVAESATADTVVSIPAAKPKLAGYFSNKKTGVGLVEIIIASSIISVTILVLLTVYTMVSKHSNYNIYPLKASQLAEETIEVLKFLRDSGWNDNIATLNTGTTYHPYWDISVTPNRWTAITSNILLEDKYEVSFVLSDVYRDSNNNVVTSGGSLDEGSRKVDVNVSWRQSGITYGKSMETYLFNIFNN